MLDLNQVQAELMLDVNAQEMMLNEYPADCCPVKFYLNFPCLAGDDDSPFWQGWANLRIKTFRLIENKYFETAVIAMILISSLALVSNQILQKLINSSTYFFVIGSGGHLLSREACPPRCPLLYGSNFYCDIHDGDGGEVVGVGVCQVLHQRLVLA